MQRNSLNTWDAWLQCLTFILAKPQIPPIDHFSENLGFGDKRSVLLKTNSFGG
jgi:hypothetical protein